MQMRDTLRHLGVVFSMVERLEKDWPRRVVVCPNGIVAEVFSLQLGLDPIEELSLQIHASRRRLRVHAAKRYFLCVCRDAANQLRAVKDDAVARWQ